MLINTHIGNDETEGQGVDGSLFQQELLQLDSLGKKRIQVWINSPGGVVMDGYNIYNAILKSKTKVDTYCVGIAASIAAVIFQAGRERTMADYSLLMYHNPYGGDDQLQLEAMKTSIATMIATRVGKPQSEILAVMQQTTWISASEAFSTGFCDNIEVSTEHNKKRLTGGAKTMWTQGNKVLNNILNKAPKMIKVTNKLGLTDSASEDAIVSAISALEQKAKEAEQKAAKLKDDMDKAKADYDRLKAEHDKLQDEKDAAEKAKNDAEDAAKTEACKNMLDGFVRTGRIKPDAVTDWTNTAKTIGADKVKAMIEALPLNRVAPKVENSNKYANVQMPTTAVSLMAQLKAKNSK
jgi:ATP-dependent Clp endopeptidase proteolytic subunit ClpP